MNQVVIGIDFGTTFSWPAAHLGLDEPEILLSDNREAPTMYELVNPDGSRMEVRASRISYGFPSVIGYSDEKIVVGHIATKLERPLRNIKMLLDDVGSSVELDVHTNGFATGNSREFDKLELVANLIKKIVESANETLRTEKAFIGDVGGIVISVPANFTYDKLDFIREAIEDNVKGAGLKLQGIIREPIAAAIAYFELFSEQQTETILMYDFGGGTCDVALVRYHNSGYQVIDYSAVKVGGRDFDSKLVELILNKTALPNSDAVNKKISTQAEGLKKQLMSGSNDSEVSFSITIEGQRHTCKVTREEYEKKTKPLMEKTIKRIYDMLDNHKNISFNKIVCVGGSSNMSMVKRTLSSQFRKPVEVVDEPQTATCLGVAIYAHNIMNADFLQDICKYSYGIARAKEVSANKNNKEARVENVILKNKSIPSKGKTWGKPQQKNQEFVLLPIIESENSHRSFLYQDVQGTVIDPLAKRIGDVVIYDTRHLRRSERIIVEMEINTYGMLEIKGTNEKTGTNVRTEFKRIQE